MLVVVLCTVINPSGPHVDIAGSEGDLNGFATRYLQTFVFNKTDSVRLSGVSRSD